VTSPGEEWTDLQRQLKEIWQEILRIPTIELDDDFFDVGGHSLAAVVMASRIGERLGVRVELSTILESPTIRSLARELEQPHLTSTPPPSTSPAVSAPQDRTLLSFGEERLWFLDRMLRDRTAYNVHRAFRLSGKLDAARLQAAILRVAERHEILRTRFPGISGRWTLRRWRPTCCRSWRPPRPPGQRGSRMKSDAS
jgi:acyl carrier protein